MKSNNFPFRFYMLLIGIAGLAPLYLKGLDIDIQEHTFYADNQPYSELNVYVVQSSLILLHGQTNKSLLMTVVVKKDQEIILAERFNLIGTTDSLNFSTVKRYGLSPGEFTIEVSAVDNNAPDNTFSWSKAVVLDPPTVKAHLSDVQLLSTLVRCKEDETETKNGFRMEILPFSFSRESMDRIYYYAELYNTVSLSTPYEIEIIVADDALKNQRIYQQQIKKKKPKKKDSVIGFVDLKELPSGNYQLICQLRDTSGKVLSNSSVAFQHSNQLIYKKESIRDQELSFIDLLSVDEMVYSLKAILPRIASINMEALDIAIQSRDRSRMVHELKYHWDQLAVGPVKQEYNEFMKIAHAVDNTFQSGYGAGFETDRGYYYLKYGRPDDMTGDKQEYDAPPYEIWTYNEIPELRQTNVKFVFYNPSLSPGNYELLHSTAKGEPNNPKWKAILYQNTHDLNGKGTFDSDNVNDGLRRNAGRKFEDF